MTECELHNFESLDGYVESIMPHAARLLIDGERLECRLAPAVADTLTAYAPCKQSLRFSGRIHWHRNAGGKWKVLDFHVMDVETLDNTPLSQVVKKLRAVTAKARLGEPPN